MKEQVIEIIISEIDFYLIEKIREMRIRAVPYISQVTLSQKLELSEGYISKVENPKERAKYNLRLVNKVVKLFKLKSYSELFPNEFPQNDIVRIRLKLLPPLKGKQNIDKSGKIAKAYELIAITPLTEGEMELWKINKLEYLTTIK